MIVVGSDNVDRWLRDRRRGSRCSYVHVNTVRKGNAYRLAVHSQTAGSEEMLLVPNIGSFVGQEVPFRLRPDNVYVSI